MKTQYRNTGILFLAVVIATALLVIKFKRNNAIDDYDWLTL